jgi:hypothetical protein
MEYLTSAEQEQVFNHRYQKRWEQEQDSLRTSMFRVKERKELQEEDRIFFVEPDGNVYLNTIGHNNICPQHHVMGGKVYIVDPMFIREVQEFTRRHQRYMIVFSMRKEYSNKAGVFPARMVTEHEDIELEEFIVEEK